MAECAYCGPVEAACPWVKCPVPKPTPAPTGAEGMSEEELAEVRERVAASIHAQNPDSVWAMTPRLLATIDAQAEEIARWKAACDQAIAEAMKSEKRVAWLESGDVHTCHDECQRPLCKVTRERDEWKQAFDGALEGAKGLGKQMAREKRQLEVVIEDLTARLTAFRTAQSVGGVLGDEKEKGGGNGSSG